MVKNYSKLWGVAPVAMSFALLATPAVAQTTTTTTPQAAADEGAPVEAIVVTGSRIQAPNLTAISPVTTVTNADIKASGTQRTEDLLNSLPQVFAAQTSTLSNGATGTATVNLRGLGSVRTLVLINGRRLMPGDVTSSAADLNFVPASMVKRVDVLTGGASATYGADAVAGVVNFVIDTNYEGFKIDANYGLFQHNNRNKITPPLLDARAAKFPNYSYPRGNVADGGQFDGTLSFGTKFGDDRGHAMAYFGYRRADSVLQGRRDYSACTVQNNPSAFTWNLVDRKRHLTPSAPLRCGGSATSNNALIYASTSTSTLTANGAVTTVSRIQSAPLNLGDGTAKQGSFNRYNFAPLNYFQRPDERYTAGAFVDYEIAPALHPYMEFMFMDDQTVAQIAPSGDFGNTLTINCDNPLMTLAQKAVICQSSNLIVGSVGTYPLVASNYTSIKNLPAPPPTNFIDPTTGKTYNKAFFQLLRRNVEGGPRRNDLEHVSFRTVLGMKGELGKAWSYDTYYQYGRTNYSQVYSNELSVARLTNALDVVANPVVGGAPICRSALSGADPTCVPYNVFTGSPSAASTSYLSATGFQKGKVSEQIASVMFNGNLGEYGIRSPGATDGVSLAIGGEYRQESLDLQTDNAFQTGDLSGQGAPTLPISGSYKVTEFISEIQIPLVQDSFFYDLSFNGGYRYSHYSTSRGGKFNTDTYKLGVDFAPVKDIRFRASYNRAVRVPNIQELFATQFVGLDGVTDPCAGHTITAGSADAGCRLQGIAVGNFVTGNPAAQYNGKLGGNPNLLPEVATTKSFGVVLQPRMIPNLSISVDYYDIKIRNAVQGYGADAILNACTNTLNPVACGLIHRNAAGSLWLTSDGYVNDLPTNVGGFRTRGIEFNGNWSHQIGGIGTFGLNFIGTKLDKLEIDNGLTQVYNCAGYYGPTCGGPAAKFRSKLRASLNTKMGLGFTAQWRYFGPVNVEYSNPSTSLAADHYNFGSHIASQSYFDLSMTAHVGGHFEWRLGVNNLLDRQPPLVTSGNGTYGASACGGTCNGNTYPGTYDALGRYIYTGVTLDF